jgi:hypothetical protein
MEKMPVSHFPLVEPSFNSVPNFDVKVLVICGIPGVYAQPLVASRVA